MKYMGSKRMMLQNGLGELLNREAATARRFVDLFAGTGAVSIHVARRFSIPVRAFDLQRYSTILTGAVIGRQCRIDWEKIWNAWLSRAKGRYERLVVPTAAKLTQAAVADFRAWSGVQEALPITRAYGGHYFCPRQSAWIDSLFASLPCREPANMVALAALIQSASQCVAAPGHTAQPFQPTRTAKPFLELAWNKDVVTRVQTTLGSIAEQFAKQCGQARVADANQAAKQLREGDLAFIDPPYSGVHYSRFYHVLETIADGGCNEVSGAGRYPALEFRPRSRYSVRTESSDALDDLLKTVASRDARAILTFPDHDCSNGLSGELVRDIAGQYFRLREYTVESRFSTLGGTSGKGKSEACRAARQNANELILVLRPK